MKRLMTVVVLIAMGGLVFAMGAKAPMTQDEALALIDQKIATMQLTTEDGAAAKEALTVMVQARIQVENAYRIVSDALDGGLRTQDMLMLTTQTRQRIQQGQSAKLCEQAAQAMVQERTRTQTELQTQTRTEAGQSGGTQAGSETSTGTGK
ncbi:MAG TPA: hypothetical protein VMX33_08345 [bacterium]|nr:hypothetical protein [bacterium]